MTAMPESSCFLGNVLSVSARTKSSFIGVLFIICTLWTTLSSSISAIKVKKFTYHTTIQIIQVTILHKRSLCSGEIETFLRFYCGHKLRSLKKIQISILMTPNHFKCIQWRSSPGCTGEWLLWFFNFCWVTPKESSLLLLWNRQHKCSNIPLHYLYK